MIAFPKPDGDGLWVLRVTGSQAAYATARNIPGLRWSSADKGFLGWPDAVEAGIEACRASGKCRGPFPKIEQPPYGVGPDAPSLWPHQLEAVAWLLGHQSGAILADEMGLGKSASALVASSGVAGRLVVVCFDYVKPVWADPESGEITKWLGPDLKIYQPETRKPAPIPPDTEIVVINYDILAAWLASIQAWAPRCLIVDEAQALTGGSTGGSARAKAVARLRAVTPSAIYLTGTPIPNRIRDLWPILDSLYPGRFGTFPQFGIRYCDGQRQVIEAIGETRWNFDGQSNLDELRARLRWVMLARTQAEVGLSLPKATRRVHWLDAPKVTEEARGLAVKGLLDRASDRKLATALEIAGSLVEGQGRGRTGRKIVVATWRKVVAEWLATRLSRVVPVGLIHGSVSGKRRAGIVEAARSAPGSYALVVTADSCATGISFAFASTLLVVELSHEPHKLLQLEKRLNRPGASLGAPQEFIYLAERGGVDEVIARRVVLKLDTIGQAMSPTTSPGSSDASSLGGTLGGVPTEDEILAEIMGLG